MYYSFLFAIDLHIGTIASRGHDFRERFFVARVHVPSPYQYTVLVLVDMKVQERRANAPHCYSYGSRITQHASRQN